MNEVVEVLIETARRGIHSEIMNGRSRLIEEWNCDEKESA